jgi:uncharacterized protein YhdP
VAKSRFSERAPVPQRDGVWVSGRLERLDVDQWQDLLNEKSGGGDDTALAEWTFRRDVCDVLARFRRR